MMESSHEDAVEEHILAVDDDSEILWIISEQFKGTKYEIVTESSVANALPVLRALASEGAPIVLTDLDLKTGNGLELLEAVVSERLNVAGAILMSGKPGFQDEAIEVARKLAALKIPFFDLQKPFHMRSLEYLLSRITLAQETAGSSLSQASRRHIAYLHSGNAGKILAQARKTLGLDARTLVGACNSQGFALSLERYESIEEDDECVSKISTSEWFYLCQLLGISTDSLSAGYAERLHLIRVRGAIEKDSFLLPVTESLRDQLAVLGRLEAEEFDAAMINR